jgi:hypothetical protein
MTPALDEHAIVHARRTESTPEFHNRIMRPPDQTCKNDPKTNQDGTRSESSTTTDMNNLGNPTENGSRASVLSGQTGRAIQHGSARREDEMSSEEDWAYLKNSPSWSWIPDLLWKPGALNQSAECFLPCRTRVCPRYLCNALAPIRVAGPVCSARDVVRAF